MDNTCLLSPIAKTELLQKQKSLFSESNNPLTILYLSSLIETKGYVEFVEAIRQLSVNSKIYINAILCGKITIINERDNKFQNDTLAREWIESQIQIINQSNCVRLNWIDGAIGEEKTKLFRQAQFFVLPSRYRSEAQPIAILEAIASGCAVITTKIGEISTTLTEETAIFLDNNSSFAIESAILKLCHNPALRENLALNGIKLFEQRFSYHKHIEKWEELLSEIN